MAKAARFPLAAAVVLVLLATSGAAIAGPKGELVWVDPVADIAADVAYAAAPISNLLYVNRCLGDCVITPGPNDARIDTSSIIQSTATLTEFAHGDQVFDATVACLRQVYEPYNVEIITDDPGAVPHHEAILAGTAEELGYPANVGGLAPASCEPLDNVISFSFANTLGAGVLDLCWTVAQESAHSFGLPNHVRDCSDPMTYIPNCGQKFFRDAGLQCGDFEPDECRCIGGQLQSSHRTLLDVFGPSGSITPPEVVIARPAPEQSVSDGFAIQFSVIDVRAEDRVDLFINGTHYDTRDGWPIAQAGAPYVLRAPDHPDGYMTVEVRARSELGTEGKASLRVLKGDPCTGDDQCAAKQSCVEGGCAYPPADRALGDSCDESRECTTGLCPSRGGNKFCSEFCDPGDAFSCQIGFDCLAAGDSGICWPTDAVDVGGGCCQVSGSGGRPPLAVLLLAALVAIATGRRRRSRG